MQAGLLEFIRISGNKDRVDFAGLDDFELHCVKLVIRFRQLDKLDFVQSQTARIT